MPLLGGPDPTVVDEVSRPEYLFFVDGDAMYPAFGAAVGTG